MLGFRKPVWCELRAAVKLCTSVLRVSDGVDSVRVDEIEADVIRFLHGYCSNYTGVKVTFGVSNYSH